MLDWEDAAFGDHHSDLAGARQELCWKFGRTAMEQFTRHYRRLHRIDPWRLALWQLFVGAAASHFMHLWSLDPALEAHMRGVFSALMQEASAQLMSNPA